MKTILKLFAFSTIFILFACSEDFYDNAINKKDLKVSHEKFENLLKDKKFSKVLTEVIVNKNKISSNSKTIMEQQYGFNITNKPVNVIEKDNITSYTLFVTRENTPSNVIENLIIQTNNSNPNDTKAFLIKYNSNIDINENFEMSNFQGTKSILPIIYNINESDTTGKLVYVETCWNVTSWYCYGPGGHSSSEGCTMGFPITSQNCMTTSYDDGTGSGGGGGTSSGSGSSSSGDVFTAPHGGSGSSDLDIALNPCDKIKKVFTKLPTLRNELSNMSGKTSESNEWGKFKTSNTNIIQTPASTASGEVSFPNLTTGQYTMMAHTHNSPANTTYSVFSWADLEVLATLVRNGKVDTENFVSFLATADGTYYAFTIEDSEAFAQFFATAFDAGFDPVIGEKRAKAMNKYFDPGKKGNPVIKENNDDNLADEKAFLDFMQDNNMGASLFESNSTFTTFDKVTHNKITDNVDKQPCN